MERQKKYEVIGLMSGTSLDGLDICYAVFQKANSGWKYKIAHAQTIKYSSAWKKYLADAINITSEELLALDVKFGQFIAKEVNRFKANYQIKKIDLIASHGHTVFHQPKRGFTLQIGSGVEIALATKHVVINDFRSLDVAKGGQGAPLVPVGDELLFTEYAACLNVGGIANISYRKNKSRMAFDICYANMGLNYLANKSGKSFDSKGLMASKGKLNTLLVKQLQSVYKILKNRPSLGREYFDLKIQPLLDNEKIPLHDRMFTYVDVCAKMIADVLNKEVKKGRVLSTGGGTHNEFLIIKIQEYLKPELKLFIPDKLIVEFKEALVFAFLGILRMRREVNCLKSVTGAKSDSSCGILHEP
jgi:anhydro-N-acetylmuramic acid kinase